MWLHNFLQKYKKPDFSKVKILSFGSLPPEWGGIRPGGVATYNASLIMALHELEKTPVVKGVMPLRNSNYRFCSKKCGNIKLHPAQKPSPETIKLLAMDYDLFLFHHVSNPWVDVYIEAGRPKPSLGIVHSWTAIKTANNLVSAAQKVQKNIDGMDYLIFPSKFCREEASQFKLSWSIPSEVVYCPLNDVFGSRANPPSGRRRSGILFAGTINDIKRVDLLLEGVSMMAGKEILKIAGEGPLLENMYEKIKTLGIQSRVKLLGAIDHYTLKREMEAAAILCVPSRSESFGLVYCEALSCGLPIIGYKQSVAEISEILNMQCGIGFDGEESSELSQKLVDALKMDWEHSKLSVKTCSTFTRKKAASVVHKIVEALL